MPTGSLPTSAKSLWEKVYNEAKKKGDSEEKAAKKAWGAVKNAGWSKDESGKWHKKAQLSEFSLAIKSAPYNKVTGEMGWRAYASDIEDDLHNDNMTLELFNDFVSHIEEDTSAPEEFQSDFWHGGMPYLSISHYPDFNGDGVPGVVDAVYIDGTYLKAKGTYNDTPLGRACFKSISRDLHPDLIPDNEKSETKDKVRISIAFLDYMHKHKSNDYVFTRKELSDFCPECLRELIEGEYAGKIYMKGQLIHLAHTRVPVNERTLMEVDKSMTTRKEDAASIIGEELAEELDEKATVDKSEAVVIKAEDETPEEEVVEVIVEEGKHDKEMKDEEEDEEDMPKKKKEEKKAEVAEVPEVIEQSIIVESHPLDTVFAEMKAAYDQAIEANLSVNDKLQLVQEPFVAIGNQIKADIENQPKPEVPNNEIMATLQALMQRMDLLDQRLEEKAIPNDVPARRSIQPAQVNPLVENVQMQKSDTPNLRSMLAKTV